MIARTAMARRIQQLAKILSAPLTAWALLTIIPPAARAVAQAHSRALFQSLPLRRALAATATIRIAMWTRALAIKPLVPKIASYTSGPAGGRVGIRAAMVPL